MAIPALIDGYRIVLPSGTLVVADGCAGLNYLLVSLVIGSYFAYISYSRWRYRLLVCLLAVLTALIGNWVRVFALVLIGYYSEMESSLVYNHGFFGWVVFAVFIILYFFLVVRFLKEPNTGVSSNSIDTHEKSESGDANSASTVRPPGLMSANPPRTKIFRLASLPPLTTNTPGLIVVITGACCAITVISPSLPGTTTESTSSESSRLFLSPLLPSV